MYLLDAREGRGGVPVRRVLCLLGRQGGNLMRKLMVGHAGGRGSPRILSVLRPWRVARPCPEAATPQLPQPKEWNHYVPSRSSAPNKTCERGLV